MVNIMSNAANQKKYKDKLVKNGKCSSCKMDNVTNPGKSRCRNCTEKTSQKNKELRYKALLNGLCRICKKNPIIENYKWCVECRDKQKKWYYQSEYREKSRILDKQRRQERKIRIFNHYGNKCVCCEENNLIFLSIDHINNDGAQHRQELTGKRGRGAGSSSIRFYKWIEKNNYPNNLQILCFNCNIGRYRNGGICPHKQSGV